MEGKKVDGRGQKPAGRTAQMAHLADASALTVAREGLRKGCPWGQKLPVCPMLVAKNSPSKGEELQFLLVVSVQPATSVRSLPGLRNRLQWALGVGTGSLVFCCPSGSSQHCVSPGRGWCHTFCVDAIPFLQSSTSASACCLLQVRLRVSSSPDSRDSVYAPHFLQSVTPQSH